ncbi:acylneuraminate cytidylyltransferase family protein [Laribacter hongkongensis]|uniref:acylneuraminate cytidylyltransferase family protein n=1 Tax=Laribacter hongkongensis TaxID=168471 RepID=UPI001EFD5200|nr:acylneuraminate cytidylyltransferase family protein [Laribacter hongkongensis]MCG8995491.1 acylneuraminate cytidylyltransferase family protein [Laribacter hongkongensis]MCG9010308.1 acylneuraminate cytidylyltransferase family protein [Laribacter hongkongensis]MCG9046202.1 acylneuraminate cytidylyltransferase family protein [Laribacter hongkongensis]MCG9051743.1 acylneuraminate cytidylyltransferase family protein [Laribacter hongkongensis]MCG9073774.1 acylneuraminate cytidylyltransferase fam
MINGKRVLALVTARAGSKGLPGKNLRLMCGKPLIAWTIEQGLASRYIDSLVVTTDGEDIARVAREHGAEVPFLRPLELASDTATSMSAVFHAIEFLEGTGRHYDLLALLEPTSPLRQSSDIDGSIELCEAKGEEASVVSVAAVESGHPSFLYCLESDYLKPMLGSQPTGLRRQDLRQNYYYLEGCVYVSPIPTLRKKGSFYHEHTIPWIVERYQAIEIDEAPDFIMAEALMSARIEGRLK